MRAAETWLATRATVTLRPDNRLVITRAWETPAARLNGALQLSKGLAKILSQTAVMGDSQPSDAIA